MWSDSPVAFTLVLKEFERRPGVTLVEVSRKFRVHRDTVRSIITQHTGLAADEWHERFMLEQLQGFFREKPTASIKEAAAFLDYSPNGLRRFVIRVSGLTLTAFHLRALRTG